jgi:hypothetical protein
MASSGNSEKFPLCTKALTVHCPYLNDPAMKRILGDSEPWAMEDSRRIDMLANIDLHSVAGICRDCESFVPEPNA